MRLAVLSDVHGNLGALRATLRDISQRGADLIVNLGDLVSGPLFPANTADLLAELDIPTIRGNHERQLLAEDVEGMGPSDRYAREQLRPEHLRWIGGLHASLVVGGEVLLVHGSPRSDVEHLVHSIAGGALAPAPEADVRARLGGIEHPVVLCGHSHLPRTLALDGGPLLVNPGSVGLPAYDDRRPEPHVVEAGSPHARYALIEKRAGRWQAALLEVDYDWRAAARQAERAGRLDWAAALGTGRVRRTANLVR